jgi:hypothetical protein
MGFTGGITGRFKSLLSFVSQRLQRYHSDR